MKTRLLSLDVLRGLTVFFMIIVNSAGNWNTIYAPLMHAKWHGFTPTDLVFPMFLFAIGSSLAIVFNRESMEEQKVYSKIIKRSIIIFTIGFLLNWFPFVNWTSEGFSLKELGSIRIMGVLQRIGLVYGLSAILLYKFPLKTVMKITVGILVGYWIVMLGLGDYSMTGNIGHKIDMILLTPAHLYKGEGVPFDPEGLLSTIPCIGNVVAGYAATFYLRQYNDIGKLKITIFGALLIGLGCLWHYGFPINKKIWTSSYVLVTSGIGVLMLMSLHYLIDMKGKGKSLVKGLSPMGKNPLFIYILSQVGMIILWWIPNQTHGQMYNAIFEIIYKPLGSHFGSFLFALTWTMFCWIIAYLLDKRKWYIRV